MRLSASIRGLMRRPAREPRPYPDPFSPSEKAVIEQALFTAVYTLKATRSVNFSTCKEIDININLELLLNRMLESQPPVIPGFSKAIFQTVVRGAELNNHDGTLPEKRPDLAFRSTRSHPTLAHPEQCVLLVECKIVDRSRTMAWYCGDGVKRFVDGTYAWAVASAIMLGYVRGRYKVQTTLQKHLAKLGARYNIVGKLQKRDSGNGQPEFYITVHDRTQVCGMPPGPEGRITIHHLWIDIV